MGDYNHYTSEIFKLNQTIDLAQACQPLIQFRKSDLKHLPVARILDGLELLKHSLARQLYCIALLLPGRLLRRKSLFRFDLCVGSRLLLFHCLTLPAAGHDWIIDSTGAKSVESCHQGSSGAGNGAGWIEQSIHPDHNFELGQKSFASW